MQEFLKGDSVTLSYENFWSHAHFRLKPCPFSIILERNFVPYLSNHRVKHITIEIFAKACMHAKVNHRSSFLSSLAREEGSYHQYFLVLDPAQRRVPWKTLELHLNPPLPYTLYMFLPTRKAWLGMNHAFVIGVNEQNALTESMYTIPCIP